MIWCDKTKYSLPATPATVRRRKRVADGGDVWCSGRRRILPCPDTASAALYFSLISVLLRTADGRDVQWAVVMTTTLPLSDDLSLEEEEEVERSLVLAQLVSSCTNLLLLFLYWSYLLYSSFSQPLSSSWPPVFPHILLLGATIGSASNLASVTLSSSCHSSSLLPISYSLVYSAMLVRLVVLHSLHRDLLVKLPSLYQALLLVTTSLVQLCLSAQSVIISLSSSEEELCPSHTPLTRDITHFSYSAFLLLFITSLSTLLRRGRENRAEAAAIWYFSLLSLVVWLAWVSVSLVFGQYYTYIRGNYSPPPTSLIISFPFPGLGLEASVVVLFITFLLPKSRRLTLVGKIYEYRQVRERKILPSSTFEWCKVHIFHTVIVPLIKVYK